MNLIRNVGISTLLLLFFIRTSTSFLFFDYLECLSTGNNSGNGTYSTVTNQTKPAAIIFYNGQTTNEYYAVSVNNGASIMDQEGFDKSRKTTIFIFGYRQNRDSPVSHAMIEALHTKNDSNVVLFDWSEYSSKEIPFAQNAAQNVLPTLLATMIQQMVNKNYLEEYFHLLSFSMGTIIAGYTGRKFPNRKIGLITGIDPSITGPICNTNVQSGDAAIVHNLHGDRGGYATPVACGDLDVFLNKNGFRPQPGCPPCPLGLFMFTPEDLCSHVTTWLVYAASISNPDLFLGVKCDSYENFKNGLCSNNIKTHAGYAVNTSISGKLYMTTNANAPYGKGLAGTMP